ncbi:alpha/beta fold hydrolase [Planococcus lenghuensis]|uniref:Esterase n=1 Tax=Planococcus lenghuensis TaxID=2213202 RepID=A0A1Q2L0E3_9BACL|nr:alpha/beta fold hydrolase [Planococcus lenghuensis]AQQ53925.1 esterase [Planococcus lenghuensis]
MKVIKEQWGEIPVLHTGPDAQFNEPLPTVVFLHGFTSAKEHNLHYAYQLAEKGIRTILPDAILHGERTEPIDQVQQSMRFWETVLTSIDELAFLNTHVQQEGLADSEIGVAGTSMGGITALGALTVYPWIRTAAIMMGSAGYVQFAEAQMQQFESRGFKLPLTEEERETMMTSLAQFDLTKNRQKLEGRPVYFWHGEKDVTVPFEPTFGFYQLLLEDYAEFPERIRFIRDRQAGHAVSREGMLEATSWLAAHLMKQEAR